MVSRAIGQREVKIMQRTTSDNGSKAGLNISKSLSEPKKRDVILPSEMALFGKRKDGIETLFVGYSPEFVLSIKIPFTNPPEPYESFVPWPKIKPVDFESPKLNTDNIVVENEVFAGQKLPDIKDLEEVSTPFIFVEDAQPQIITPSVRDEFLDVGEPPAAEGMADDFLAELACLDHLQQGIELVDLVLPEVPPPSTKIEILPGGQSVVDGAKPSGERQRKPRSYVVAES